MVKKGIAIVTVVLLSACASVPRASRDLDSAAKEFKAPAQNKAQLYVFRDETFGGNWGMDLLLDGRLIGQTTHHTFILADVEPGPHTLMGRAENDDVLKLDAKAGETMFVWQEVKTGVWKARNQLQRVDEKRGRQGVVACELVASP